jgi:uncharacterized repeat protein (TIGR03803 family)
LTATSARSAGYKVLYDFGLKSITPSSGLIFDAAGNAYGVTSGGGYANGGTVYELSPKTGHHLPYAFHGGNSGTGGFLPQGNLVLDSKGNLYGTTVYGGVKNSQCEGGCGVVFELSPPLNGGQWIETVLYRFCSQANCADGANPQAGVIFDSAGNLYSTTYNGGIQNCQNEGPGCGTVFELSPDGSGWTESVIHNFGGVEDGVLPYCNLVFDGVGNLYGPTAAGGDGNGGTVFELSPSGNSWIETVLYSFHGFSGSTDGYAPSAGVMFDATGNLYGTTAGGCANLYYGTVFELSPGLEGWTETILHSFASGTDGAKPESGLALDLSGNLYGTTVAGGSITKACLGGGCGTVFRLSPSNGQWTEDLFRFPTDSDDGDDGLQPTAPVFLDAEGRVYGTTTAGGKIGNGVAFRITQ